MTINKKKSNYLVGFLGVALSLIIAIIILFFGPNTGNLKNGIFLYVPTNSNYEQLIDNLSKKEFIHDKTSFEILAKIFGLPIHVHSGKYQIKKGMSNFQIIRMLRYGKQIPVKLVINKLRTKQDFINLISNNLEADSKHLNEILSNSEFLETNGLDSNTIMCAILPNTYDFFWNTTAENALKKIIKNYTRFWDNERKELAQKEGLTPIKATILASIVEEETNIVEDKPIIASVYLNRLKKGMKLQADPTIRFAIGDFSIKRITGKMLNYNSTYNTYRYQGLPPGPICTPQTQTIQAVLNAPQTKYLYFCAKADFSGHSDFATNFEEQIKNAKAYQKELNKRGI